MAISPVLLNGSIQQTDNVLQNQIKQVEKGMVDQSNIQVQKEKKEELKARQVVHSDETLFKEGRFDAKGKTAILGMEERSADRRRETAELCQSRKAASI